MTTQPEPIGTDTARLSTRLGDVLPLLSLLVQAVARADGPWNFVNVTVGGIAWLGVARAESDTKFVLSTNAGDAANEPYVGPVNEALVALGYEHVPKHLSYSMHAPFDSDEAFVATAHLMLETLQTAYGVDAEDLLGINLVLAAVSAPKVPVPVPPVARDAQPPAGAAPSIERRFLGIAEVDSGTLLIADPAYVLPREKTGKPGVDYEEVVLADGSIHAQRVAELPVVLLQKFGGDGSFPVFGDFDGGELIGIWINLDPPMDNEDEE